MSNIFIGLKKTCLGILDRGERDKNNEIGLKEGGGIEMSTTVLPFAMLAPFALCTYRFAAPAMTQCFPLRDARFLSLFDLLTSKIVEKILIYIFVKTSSVLFQTDLTV